MYSSSWSPTGNLQQADKKDHIALSLQKTSRPLRPTMYCHKITSSTFVSLFPSVPHLSVQIQLLSLASGCTIFSAETVFSLCLYSAQYTKTLVYPRSQERRLGDTWRPVIEAADSS